VPRLFQVGDFYGHSGGELTWKVECQAFTLQDWKDIAWIIMHSRTAPMFGTVEGVPRGGAPLARALERYSTPGAGLLIVDDVMTTGRSMEEHRGKREAMGLVVFARMIPPSWVQAMWILGV